MVLYQAPMASCQVAAQKADAGHAGRMPNNVSRTEVMQLPRQAQPLHHAARAQPAYSLKSRLQTCSVKQRLALSGQ